MSKTKNGVISLTQVAAQVLPLIAGMEINTANRDPLLEALRYPRLRFMGSKHRLLPWIYEALSGLQFHTALDAFSGSGCVAYLLKSMGKTVTTNDFLQFSHHLTNALVANPGVTLTDNEVRALLATNTKATSFIESTFKGVFFSPAELQFLDNTWAHLRDLNNPWKISLVISAMCRAAIKKQPRGVFTIATDKVGKYDDGRRDLQLSLQDHFVESIQLFNELVHGDGLEHRSLCSDVFNLRVQADLVYLDPPYVPRSDDNCYIKRYHFLEGLSCYWEGLEIMQQTKVKKIAKRYTPFSYRRTAVEAFHRLFGQFPPESILVLSYSSNGYPDLNGLIEIMKHYRCRITVHRQPHRYHFGTHENVSTQRALVEEYLIVGE